MDDPMRGAEVMAAGDVLSFAEVMVETVSLVRTWTDSDEDKRRLACVVSVAALLAPAEREHVARLLIEAGIEREAELRYELDAGKRVVFAANFNNLVDIVIDREGRPSFLLIIDGKPEVVLAAEDPGRPFEILRPPPRKTMPWLLCRGAKVLEHLSDGDEQLWDDLSAYLQERSELPSGAYYDLLTAWVMHAWTYEHSKYSPMMWFYGLWERGKTRTGEALLHLCRRGLLVESLKEAYLLRMANNFGCTILFDVEDLWSKARLHGTTDVLLKRFEKNALVPRVLWPGRGPFEDTEFFAIYGPTLIATNVEVPEGLASRAIQIRMPESPRTFEHDLDPADALPLKERLCAFRFRRMTAGPMPVVNKTLAGRLGDIFRPLHEVMRLVRPTKEDEVIDLMKAIAADRSSSRGDSVEGRIVQCLLDLSSQVKNGCLDNQKIMQKHRELFTGYVLKPEVMGKTVRALGFRGKRSGTVRSVVYDEELLELLRVRMGI